MATYEEWNAYASLRNSIEIFGAAYTWDSKKKYLFGQLQMADAFIAWSNSSVIESEMDSSNWR